MAGPECRLSGEPGGPKPAKLNGRFRTWLDQVLNRLATQITVVCVESPSSHAFELQLSRKLSRGKSVGYLHFHSGSEPLHRKMGCRGPLVLGAALARLPAVAVHLVRRRAVSAADEYYPHDRQG